jgi:hypothetical protein
MNTTEDWLVMAQQSADPVLEQLDPPRRAAVIMALLALVLIGLFLVTIAMLGGHWVRRLARHRPGAARVSARDEAARKNRQLQAALQPILPDAKSSETVQIQNKTKDTRVDS